MKRNIELADMVLLTFLTLCTFHKKRGRGKGGGAYETTKSKNQSALNCTMLARLTHVPIKKTNTKRFRKRANQSCGSLSPNTSQQTRRKPIARCWLPNSPANMSALSTQLLLISSREKKCTRPFENQSRPRCRPLSDCQRSNFQQSTAQGWRLSPRPP